MTLTDVQIKALKPPERGQASYADGTIPGFSLRVSQGGTRTFCLVFGNDRRRITIGRYPIISLAQARSKAREILAQITLGTHKPQKGLTFQDAFDLYRLHKLPQNRESSRKESERLLRKGLLRFQLCPLSDITTPDLAAFLDRTTEKAHLHVALSTLFSWCVSRGYVGQNPLSRLRRERRPSRDRALTPTELRSVLRAAEEAARYGQLIRFLIYTGQRLGQAHALTEAHIDRDKMTLSWPGSEMKTGRPHSIPYGPLTGNLLNQAISSNPGPATRLFTKTERVHAKLVKAAGVEWFTRGDLRRTWRTTHAMIGSMPHIAERLMAHSVGNRSQQVLRNSLHLLMGAKQTLLAIPKILTNSRFRHETYKTCVDPVVLSYWRDQVHRWREAEKT